MWQAAGQWASRGDVPCGTLWQIGRFSNHFKRIQAILFAWYWRDMKMFTGSWDYTRFKKAFYAKTGLNLDCYKDKQMERRIRQMMLRENRPDFNLFYNYLSVNLPAMERFCHYLTINTSEGMTAVHEAVKSMGEIDLAVQDVKYCEALFHAAPVDMSKYSEQQYLKSV